MYKNLEAILNSKGISKKQLGIILGISEKTVFNKINGTTDFTYSEFKKVMTLLNEFNADYVFHETESGGESNDHIA